jgi:molecular chaperone HscA
MALLQIMEPGFSRPPHEHRLAVGIDLGTTYSLVATVRSSIPQVIRDSNNEGLVPSVVRYLEDGAVIVGVPAKAAAVEDPANTIMSVKRLIGRGMQDIREHYPYLPYELVNTDSAVPRIHVGGKLVSAVEVSAEILRMLRLRAEAALGEGLYGAVITVPAYFDDAQRQATKDAAKLAGLNVLRLLNEPTAAAVAYGLDRAARGRVAVYDLGGGTFDISVLSLENGVFQVLSTGGDTALGGDDIDILILNWIAQQSGIAILDNSIRRMLLNMAVDAKEQLSTQPQVELNLDAGGRHWHGILDRSVLNTLIQPLIERTLKICRRALRDANLEKDAIDEVVMVGGSTRIPQVRDEVSRFFGRRVLTDINPDEVVAIGAAAQAEILAGNKPQDEMLLLDVIPLSLGIETMGGLVERIIPRNSALPIQRSQEFTTFKDGQTAIAIHVVQGERELVSDCRSLARFELRGIPPLTAGAARIRVTFRVDADGLLNVSAQEQNSGVAANVQVKPSYGLTDVEIAAMLQASMQYAADDMVSRRLKEQQIEAERVLQALDAALAVDADAFLNAAEKKAILDARAALVQAQSGADVVGIRRAVKLLETASEVYVSRRMNAGIQRALAGHRIEEY